MFFLGTGFQDGTPKIAKLPYSRGLAMAYGRNNKLVTVIGLKQGGAILSLDHTWQLIWEHLKNGRSILEPQGKVTRYDELV